eukprot:3336136-Alexandrium_andersonii.AAC.1
MLPRRPPLPRRLVAPRPRPAPPSPFPPCLRGRCPACSPTIWFRTGCRTRLTTAALARPTLEGPRRRW